MGAPLLLKASRLMRLQKKQHQRLLLRLLLLVVMLVCLQQLSALAAGRRKSVCCLCPALQQKQQLQQQQGQQQQHKKQLWPRRVFGFVSSEEPIHVIASARCAPTTKPEAAAAAAAAANPVLSPPLPVPSLETHLRGAPLNSVNVAAAAAAAAADEAAAAAASATSLEAAAAAPRTAPAAAAAATEGLAAAQPPAAAADAGPAAAAKAGGLSACSATSNASAAAAAAEAAAAAGVPSGSTNHLLFDAETFQRMQVLREKIHALQISGIQLVKESDLRDVLELLCERRLLEDVLRLARQALLANIQQPTPPAAAAAGGGASGGGGDSGEEQQQRAKASASATAALQRLDQLSPQLLRHAAALRLRVAAQKTERLLGLMLLRCTARLRLGAEGKAKFVGILARVFQNPKAEMRAIVNSCLYTTEEIEDFCDWLQSGILYGETTERLSGAQVDAMRLLLAAAKSLHAVEGQGLDRWADGQTLVPSKTFEYTWNQLADPLNQQQRQQEQQQQHPGQQQQQQQQ
ncbi:hypothetical protein Esti_000867 [Eimeria stiedai]